MAYFVAKNSIVHQIWGKSDTVLVIFAGAAAEFALNKSVDWLFYTGQIPSDPLKRLFSTVSYARRIVFSEEKAALNAIKKINAIHRNVENNRNSSIPARAYRDVLFMLIDYSICAFELLERRLTYSEKEDIYKVFQKVGLGMEIPNLPGNLGDWQIARKTHLKNNQVYSSFSRALFKSYRRDLGPFRYFILTETQKMVLPSHVKKLLGYRRSFIMPSLIHAYKIGKKLRMERIFKQMILPGEYKEDILQLDISSK
ncbi:oxygenase MpaB family protein [Christiangramia sabulilitoris]|uniref:DUF2236 domain-containing protein n=1 Tax=Christiangramia sabulilitoris TaxID=2583991 RepID=A0A550I3C0_9FLAO|nr:oxygenase MpaB family protein [Christiangramia sabulilitoris]TRO65482.1 DUF2236 domain-containing protein [Christiangramia sabulilitoris]